MESGPGVRFFYSAEILASLAIDATELIACIENKNLSGAITHINNITLDANGTSIAGNSYLIFWCDEDQEEGTLHTNFKLSASGETIYLADKDGAIVDSITYSNATEDLSFARIPNGTGAFKQGSHTFNANNTPVATYEVDAANALLFYPNPTSTGFVIKQTNNDLLSITNVLGQPIWKGYAPANTFVSTQDWREGIYIVTDGTTSSKLLIQK